MCGWLPYSNVFKDIAGEENLGDIFSQDNGDDDPFARLDDEASDDEGFASKGEKKDGASKAVEYLREETDMEDKTGAVFKNIPVFLGHGTKDENVSIALGREARACLEMVDVEVRMVEYKDLGHWYSPEMLDDIFRFLKERLEG
jgi:pimeloyl-ACP methyl ester carboxylesterase